MTCDLINEVVATIKRNDSVERMVEFLCIYLRNIYRNMYVRTERFIRKYH